MHPIEMDILVAMRHEELRRLRQPRRGRPTITEPLDNAAVAHRVCGRFAPVTQPAERRCA